MKEDCCYCRVGSENEYTSGRRSLSPPGVPLARGLTRSFQDISRLKLFAAAGFAFDTVLTVAGWLSGTACDATLQLSTSPVIT
jgi:hypothetical protein